MEFKVFSLAFIFTPTGRINRIRLEFKDVYLFNSYEGDTVLIESDWNLKNPPVGLKTMEGFVLIESDWNLKLIIDGFAQLLLPVLIESDWNLK